VACVTVECTYTERAANVHIPLPILRQVLSVKEVRVGEPDPTVGILGQYRRLDIAERDMVRLVAAVADVDFTPDVVDVAEQSFEKARLRWS
jgi:hypothetical protein